MWSRVTIYTGLIKHVFDVCLGLLPTHTLPCFHDNNRSTIWFGKHPPLLLSILLSLQMTTTTTTTESLDDYIRTASGNFVSRHATLQGAAQVELEERGLLRLERGADLEKNTIGVTESLQYSCNIAAALSLKY